MKTKLLEFTYAFLIAWVVLLTAALVTASVAKADAPQAPEVDVSEVLRLGNMVQIIDGQFRSDDTDVAVEALGPPADDDHKWFISVVGMKGCAACNLLKAAWKTDPHLLALANPEDTTTSWAHLNFYDREDASQSRRWAGLKITRFPTLYVQPPRSGKYGDPGKVVCQIVGFDGNGKNLALSITRHISKYATKNVNAPKHAFNQLVVDQEYGVNPPFTPPPKVDGPATSAGVTFPELVYPKESVVEAAGLGPVALGAGGMLVVLVLLYGLFKLPGYFKSKADDRDARLMRMMQTMVESSKEGKV